MCVHERTKARLVNVEIDLVRKKCSKNLSKNWIGFSITLTLKNTIQIGSEKEYYLSYVHVRKLLVKNLELMGFELIVNFVINKHLLNLRHKLREVCVCVCVSESVCVFERLY